VQGGSSISQQLAKNLFLSNERTIERKVKEAFLALWLEVRLPKNAILKLYLDRAYLGGGTFGVDAAAQYYFNKSARDVNLAEAAGRCGARHGRRPRLQRAPVQSRHGRAAPARLLVQALCLFHRAHAWFQANFDRGRLSRMHRQLVPQKLRWRLLRLDDAHRG